MEHVVVSSSPRYDCNKCTTNACPKPVYTTYQPVYNQVYPVRPEDPLGPECCIQEEINVPLKKTCLTVTQSPVFLFITLLAIFYLVAAMYAWRCQYCSDGETCVESSQQWTAFAVNTIVFIILAVLVSMWLYRLAQYKQTRLTGLFIAVTVPFAAWILFATVNSLAMKTNWCLC